MALTVRNVPDQQVICNSFQDICKQYTMPKDIICLCFRQDQSRLLTDTPTVGVQAKLRLLKSKGGQHLLEMAQSPSAAPLFGPRPMTSLCAVQMRVTGACGQCAASMRAPRFKCLNTSLRLLPFIVLRETCHLLSGMTSPHQQEPQSLQCQEADMIFHFVEASSTQAEVQKHAVPAALAGNDVMASPP